MQLIEQKRIRLEDAAEKYLPALADLKVLTSFDRQSGSYTVKPAARRITVRHLFTHTSGLGYNFTSPVVRDFKPRNGEQYVAGPLLFEPGSEWLYGTSTDWLGRLVEVVSGQDLETYFREHIFQPLGMFDTAYIVSSDRLQRMIPPYRRRPDGEFERRSSEPPAAAAQVIGGGGLASTAEDYARFVQMLLNGGTGRNVRVLSVDSVNEMGRNQIGGVPVRALRTAMPQTSSDFTFVADGRDKWGLGFLISMDPAPGTRTAGSLSWGGINNTYFWVDKQKGIAGVVLMQFQPFADGKALAVLNAFERAVYSLPSVNVR
jgi:CubicO group peptidase (beta-lactamase class C family)